MAKVLLADDDVQLAALVRDWLEHHNFDLDTARDGDEAREFLASKKYDVVVLDWGIPIVDGIELCRWFRGRGGTTPVLMLTGRSDIDDKEIGFAAGVDDYLTKPFEMRELTMRLNALLRRGMVESSRTVRIGPLVVDPDSHTVTVDGKDVTLTATEFAVLDFMSRHPQQVFSANALLDRVWKSDSDVSPDTVRVYIRRLREKLQAVGHDDLIRNVHGVGYKLVAN